MKTTFWGSGEDDSINTVLARKPKDGRLNAQHQHKRQASRVVACNASTWMTETGIPRASCLTKIAGIGKSVKDTASTKKEESNPISTSGLHTYQHNSTHTCTYLPANICKMHVQHTCVCDTCTHTHAHTPVYIFWNANLYGHCPWCLCLPFMNVN